MTHLGFPSLFADDCAWDTRKKLIYQQSIKKKNAWTKARLQHTVCLSVWSPLGFESFAFAGCEPCLCATVWAVCGCVGGWHASLPLWDDALKKGSIIYHRKRRKWNDSSKETITGDQEQEGTGTSHCLHHINLSISTLARQNVMS